VRKIRNRIQKGRCEKKKIGKCQEVCRTYDKVQAACLDYLSRSEDIAEIQSNVFLDGLEEDAEYTTDFMCKKSNGDLLVRECVYRKNLLRPSVALLLEKSRQFWFKRGVLDWQVVVEKEEPIGKE
jgi:hypothetical protein